jgi:flagellar biosynthesis protein FlhF
MELKRILAKDLRSASDQAMARHGPDAMIIMTGQYQGLTELIIAVESPSDSAVKAPNAPGQAHSPPPPASPEAPVTTAEASVAAGVPPSEPSREIVDTIRSEIAMLRQEMLGASRLGASAAMPAHAPEVRSMIHHLLDEGVPGRLQARLAPAFAQARNAAQALESLGELLGDLLEPVFAPPEDDDWSGVHILYGPPGAGKTMMCARLAGVAATRLGSQGVAWISYQDPRLGAWSQTQALAAQIGVDAFRARDAESLAVLLDELDDRGAVFVDTAHSDGQRLAGELRSIADRGRPVHLHAVVGADASVQTLRRLAATAGGQTMMVTRLDVASQPWPLIDHLVCEGTWRVCAVSAATNTSDRAQTQVPRRLVESTLSPLLSHRHDVRTVVKHPDETEALDA